MKIEKTPLIVVILLIIVSGFYFYRTRRSTVPTTQLYWTQNPAQTTIKQTVFANGKLEIKDNFKIGSLVSGTVQKILVQENDTVKKDQLLAIIDNGKRDTDVKQARAVVARVQAEYDYLLKFYTRQEALYNSGQLAQDSFDKISRDLAVSRAQLMNSKAFLEKQTIEFNNTRIRAPESGTIINTGVLEGQRVTTDLDATVLFVIAQDITKMEGKINIDESDIGSIKPGLKVKFTVDSYPRKSFRAIIDEVSFSPRMRNGTNYYKATIEVDNGKSYLRPGMTIHAKIRLAKAKDTLAVTNQAFQIDPVHLKQIAKKLHYDYLPLLDEKKKQLRKENRQYQTKFVWLVKEKKFIEHPILIDITDDIFYQVVKGLDPNNHIVVDLLAPDKMSKVYKKWFSGAL